MVNLDNVVGWGLGWMWTTSLEVLIWRVNLYDVVGCVYVKGEFGRRRWTWLILYILSQDLNDETWFSLLSVHALRLPDYELVMVYFVWRWIDALCIWLFLNDEAGFSLLLVHALRLPDYELAVVLAMLLLYDRMLFIKNAKDCSLKNKFSCNRFKRVTNHCPSLQSWRNLHF